MLPDINFPEKPRFVPLFIRLSSRCGPFATCHVFPPSAAPLRLPTRRLLSPSPGDLIPPVLPERNVRGRLHPSVELPPRGADVTARILHGLKVRSVLLCDGAGSATW